MADNDEIVIEPPKPKRGPKQWLAEGRERAALMRSTGELPADPLADYQQPVWSQQPGETRKGYAMFLAYSNIPPAERSYTVGWRAWSGKNTAVSGQYKIQGYKWHWVERALALDEHRELEKRLLWDEREMLRREQDWNAGQKLRDKALPALEKVEIATASEATTMIQVASNLQRNAIPDVDLPADQIQQILAGLDPEKKEIVLKGYMMRIGNKE